MNAAWNEDGKGLSIWDTYAHTHQRERDGFALIYVDCDTLERPPKLSAEWFGEAARQNAVV